MRFGPLDTFSAFPFENFLGKIKKMIRKPKFPLSQAIRRLSEMQSTEGTSKTGKQLKECSLKGEHTLGPLPLQFNQYSQFSGMNYDGLYFSMNDGDNCIKVGSRYGLIRNICKGSCNQSDTH